MTQIDPVSGQQTNQSSKMLRIGILVGRDLIGDALMKLPFLRALRHAYPEASIHWITSQGSTAFASQLRDATRGLIDVVEETPAWIKPDSDTPKPFFDLLIDTRNRWREARAAKKIPHGRFIAMALHYLMSDKVPSLDAVVHTPKHLSDRMMQLIKLAAGWPPPMGYITTGSLPLRHDLLAQAKAILPPGPVYVGLAPGAGNPVKIWPRYKFEQVAAKQAVLGRVPVFLLGPQELPWFDELRANIPTAKFPLQDDAAWGTAQLSIDHTLAIASCLDIAVANDSGVGHMLAATDCPLLTLFGPTSPDKLAPRVTYGAILRAQDFGGEEHMPAIPVDAVEQALTSLLEKSLPRRADPNVHRSNASAAYQPAQS